MADGQKFQSFNSLKLMNISAYIVLVCIRAYNSVTKKLFKNDKRFIAVDFSQR